MKKAIFSLLLIAAISTSANIEVPNQVVLKYDRTVGATRFFIPQRQIAIGLVPVDAAAPLAPNDLAICKMEVSPLAIQTFENKPAGTLDGIVFRCGENKYVFQTLATYYIEKK
jgi:hypothetical protein